MSTDDGIPAVPPVPTTRAELRAAREAAERVEAERIAVREAAERDAVREAAERDAVREAAEQAEAEQAEAERAVPQVKSPPVVVEPALPAEDAEALRSTSLEPRADDAPSGHRFAIVIAAVLGVFVLVGTGLGIVSLTQGPRISSVQVDREQAIESSGTRAILTTNQALAEIDPDQVSVDPEVPFTVDASGRGIGIRFTVPLHDATKYTIRIADVTGAGGGPTTDLTTTFSTPASSIFLLRRDAAGDDKIFRTDLSGKNGVVVFQHDKINDFRATSTRLVVAVADDDGSRLLVMRRDGSSPRELTLPGRGFVGAIQVSDRGGLVGYNYSDAELSDTEGRASVLVTQSLNGGDKPRIIEVGDAEASVFAWQFVPDSAAVLFIDFDGALSLVDRSTDAGVQSLGLATTIQGISRGTYTAIVERLDGSVVELDLKDGTEEPLAASNPDYGTATSIIPYPGGTLRHVVARDESGLPIGQAVVRVDDQGTAEPLVEVGSSDSILQACASPSGQFAAVVIAPDLTENAYDGMLLPLPEKLETHLIEVESGKEIVALTGFDASWCQTAPRF